MYNLLLLFILSLCIPSLSMGAGGITLGASERNLEIDFSFDNPIDSTKKLAGYRLYMEGSQICATNDPTVSKMACAFTAKDGTFDFTLKAYYDDGTESLPSPAYSFVVSSTHSVNLAWEVDSGTANQGGFRIYNNGTLIQEVTDPSARQFTYTSEFSTADNTFTIAAVDGNGGEKQLSGALTSSEAYPPTAVLSSSTAAGNAPLTVNFDGSSSTATKATLAKYSWTFGDGAQAAGATVSHTYTAPGTYYARLTVEDSYGSTDSTETPIVVGQPTAENKKPTAIISANASQGLTVAFDGAQSSDPDGSIVQYSWDFGDGATGSGATAQHAYAKTGAYTVSLQVTDEKGATATASKELQVGASLPIEVGEISINHEWVKVLFETPFVDPVVIAGPPTIQGTDPATVRIRNINQQGFEIRMQEWDYLDQTHVMETVNYLVIEKGVHTLSNGSKIEAGTFTGTTTFSQVALKQPFKVVPVILTQVVTNNETDAVTGRVRNIQVNSFAYRLQEQESTMNSHMPETIGYLALEPGQGEISGLLFEAGVTENNATHNWTNITFKTAFPEQPAIVAGMQTTAGNDTAAVRFKDRTNTAVQVKIEEEKSKDAETNHVEEVVGYLVFGAAATVQQ